MKEGDQMKKDTEGLVILCDLSDRVAIKSVWEYAKETLHKKENGMVSSIGLTDDKQMCKLFLMADYNYCDEELYDVYEYAKNTLPDSAAMWIIQGYKI